MLRLIVEKGEPAGAVFDLAPGETTLGRSRSATCRFPAPDISGTHAVIRVTAAGARIENLSQFGTRVNGAPVSGTVALAPGQRIEIGRATVLRVDDAAAEAPTGTGAAAPATAAATAAPPAAAPAPQPSSAAIASSSAATRAAATGASAMFDNGGDFSDLTRSLAGMPSGGAEEDEEGATRAMQTRAATPEEIDHLRGVEHKRTRRRLSFLLAIGVPAVILILLFRPRPPPPETEIEWPRDAGGNYLDAFAPAPSGGFREDGFDLCYPGNGTFARRAVEGGMALEGQVGRKLDVPMRVILQEERETRFAGMTRDEAVADWIERTAGSGGHWNFDRPSPAPAFFGRKNGIPYVRVTYLRDGGGSWFGVASVMCHGSRRIVARTEVPADERVRAEKMMSARLIRPSDAFEYSHWEGPGSPSRLDEAETLRQIRADLERTAPATWVALEKLLHALLAQAAREGNGETEAAATALLTRLRERQSLYFNSQKLAFDAALMQNNRDKAAKIAEFAKAVFSNVEDRRYFDVRKWRTEF